MARKRARVLAGAMSAAVVGTLLPAAAHAAGPHQGTSVQRSAEQLLSQAQRELQTARANARTVEQQAVNGEIDAAMLANLPPAGDVLEPGTTDIEMVAALLDPDNPEAALRTASIAELTAARAENPQFTVPETPVVLATADQALQAAQDRVAEAEARKESAEALIRQIEGATKGDGPGSQKLAELCADTGVVVDICRPGRWNEAHLTFDSVVIGRYVAVTWPEIRRVGGYRPYDPYPDHPSGRAVDIMMPNGGKGTDVELGTEIAKYFQDHAEDFGIEYLIWRQRMWIAGTPTRSWVHMSDRGSPTANHMDHVHITVKTGHSGNAFHVLKQQAQRAATTA